MNICKKAFCRIYQGAFRIVTPLLPWRKPELIEGGIEALPGFIKSLSVKSVLLVTDKGISSLKLTEPLLKGLKQEGISCTVYDKTVPNPTIDNIEEALNDYKANNCEAIIAFGGGSPMDCAKAIGARVVKPNKPVQKMKGVLKILKKLPPLFAIPTTSGTGSEATLAAVVTNSKTHEKYAINDTSLIPRYAILDPAITVKLPPHITSTTGIDALTHAVEAYIGHSNTKETREMARKAVKLIFDNLKKAYDKGDDLEARKNMQLAAYYAGIAFTRAYVGYVHAVAHTLGGFYGVPHGLANAVILTYFLEEYGDKAWKPLAELNDLIDNSAPEDSLEIKANKFIKAIKDLNKSLNIPDKIDGIKEEDIPLMAKRASAEGNPLYPVPKEMDKNELERMYYKIMK
ncbi:MAG: iron-containing alcohol dehydrogenase [Christensenellales bacterium]|jgi:alcohol dehydrogenase